MKKHPLLLVAATCVGLSCTAPALAGDNAQANALINEVRRATATFHSLDAAAAAGWNVPLTGCIAHPDPAVGGMGYHYVNESVISDGAADPLQPETLVYAPSPNGLKLVAVEYIVFTDQNPTPPELFGQTFHLNPNINAWTLHVWLWKHNPSGLFADFNPSVSCE